MFRRVLAGLLIVAVLAAGAIFWFFRSDGVRTALERQASAWLGQPVRIGGAAAQFFPRVAIRLREVRVGEPVRLTLAEVAVSTGLRALLSRRIEDADVVVSNSRVEMPLPFRLPIPTSGARPSSATGGSTAAAGPGLTVASVSSIALRDVRLVSRGREIVVSADSSLAGTRLNVARLAASAGATSIEARGVVELSPRLDATLEATANRLDVDDLLTLAHAFSSEEKPVASGGSWKEAMRIRAKVTSPRATVAGLDLGGFATTLAAEGNRVTLSPLSFGFFGGRYEGALNVDAATTLSVAVTSRITNLDVAQLAAFGGVGESITGRLSGTGRFTGRGRDIGTVLAAASGGGSIEIADGTLRRLDVVRTVILFFGRPVADAPPPSGERFERLASTFTLARQIVSTDHLTLHSPDLDIAAAGTLEIQAKAIAGRGNILLSEALSRQAGTDLYRFTREGNRVVLPAIISGTLDRPRVTIDAAAAARRGLRNEVDRRLKGLLDKLKPLGR